MEISRLDGEIERFEAGPEEEALGDEEEDRNYAKEIADEIKELKTKLAEKGFKNGRGKKKSDDVPTVVAATLKEIEALEKKLEPWQELREQLAEARRKLKELSAALAGRLSEARAKLSMKDCRELVLALAWDDLDAVLHKYMAEHLQSVVGVLCSLWDKYAVPMIAIERARDSAEIELADALQKLYPAKKA